jgi:DNA-binding LacI/PurR family transcriptional regulator
VDGVVVLTPYSGIEDALTEVARSTPLVAVSDRPSTSESVASIDSHAAAGTATRHLLALGHTRILHVAGPAGRNEAHERTRGYREAMIAAGLEPFVVDVSDDWSPASGFRAAQALGSADFTAVFTANDEIALGFMSAMERRGLRAPHGYSIVGVDDMPSAAFFSPPLTTMRLDFRTLGAQAFRMLHRELSTGDQAGYYSSEAELVIRESTASRDRSR